MQPRCGCGALAEYLVYKDDQPHCKACMLDAVDCPEKVPVNKADWSRWDERSGRLTAQNQSSR